VSDQVDLPRERWRLFARIAVVLFILFPSLLSAIAQHANGCGAMSAQDMAKMASAAGAKVASPYAPTADPADQVCARFASGSATTSSSSACNGTMSATATNIHFHGTNVAPVCGQDEVVHTLIQPGQSFDYNVQTDPGTPKGTYTVVVTATGSSGSSQGQTGQQQTSVNVPITIQ
jgi:FtsP/CotA-like multicopper oxidase with cupredoxin domain